MNHPPFDKYEYYYRAVQDPDPIIDFVENAYGELNRGKSPQILREDFCGTFALASAWVQTGKKKKAFGVDLSSEPLAYGKERFFKPLSQDEQKRLTILKTNVMRKGLPKADAICALNFSFYILKSRKDLLRYFSEAKKSLRKDGIFFLDCFGGPDTMAPVEDKTNFNDFTYFWDQVSFDPLTHEAKFYIHFKRRGERKRRKLFFYDWRMWTIPELKDILKEAGFKQTHVYWEGNDRNGDGNGQYRKVTKGENCEAWVAYLVAKAN